MRIFLTEKEVLDLAFDFLDINPNPDMVHNIALTMDMKYDESLDMYEDIEEYSIRSIARSVALITKIKVK